MPGGLPELAGRLKGDKMQINTKFDLGQQVYNILLKKTEVWITCTACNARGQICLADGEKIACPKCYGRKGQTDYRDDKWHCEGPLTVGQVRVEITNSPGMHGGERFDNYKAQEGREESYMCVETGVGSGAIYYTDTLYASAEEAIAECEKRNQQL